MSRQNFKTLEHLSVMKLPTELQALQRHEHLRLTHDHLPVTDTVDILVDEILAIWNRAFISTQLRKNVKRTLLQNKNSLINCYIVLKKKAQKGQCIDLSCFDVLFDIKDSGKFRNEEDRAFYLDQKRDRVSTIGSVDVVDTMKIQDNLDRYSREGDQERSNTSHKPSRGRRKLVLECTTPPTHEKRKRYAGSYMELDSSFSDSSFSEDNEWEDIISPRGKYYRAQRDSPTINASINIETFLDNVAHISDKTITTSRAAVQIVGATLSTANISGNSELKRLSLSHSTLHRKRDSLRLSSDKLITENWIKKKEKSLFLLHWDEKSLRNFRQVDGTNSYMAVVLTDLFTGEEKVLAILKMENSKAEEGASVIIQALQHWKIANGALVGFVFDTTNTNSGWKSGIVVRLEEFLERRVLHVYCRHHVFERLVNDTVNVCLGESTSPEVESYNFFISNWTRIDTTEREKLQVDRKTQNCLKDVTEFATHMLNVQVKLKDDYQEVLYLTLILTGALPENFLYEIRPPGSISHARWMAKLLCEFKIVIFSAQLIHLKLITEAEAELHKQLVLFLILYYVQPWMTATIASDAPVNDISLVNSLKKIPNHLIKIYPLFKSMGIAMNSRLEEHLWYLSEEFVVFSLFSKKVSRAQKINVGKLCSQITQIILNLLKEN